MKRIIIATILAIFCVTISSAQKYQVLKASVSQAVNGRYIEDFKEQGNVYVQLYKGVLKYISGGKVFRKFVITKNCGTVTHNGVRRTRYYATETTKNIKVGIEIYKAVNANKYELVIYYGTGKEDGDFAIDCYMKRIN